MDDAAYRALIAGRRRGWLASITRLALAGLSCFYSAGLRLRNWTYDVGLRPVHQAPVPVISVGNLTAGGTGKTPFVAHLVHWFAEKGTPVGLVSRGYRALPDQQNDEKRVLEDLCPGTPHLQHADRLRAAREACRQFDCRLLILDDGFQHRRLGRDLDIVLIDATNPWGYERLLPRGLLREPLTALRRADLIVLTRADQCQPDRREAIRERAAALGSQAELLEVAFAPVRLRNARGETRQLEALRNGNVLAFCGIGNPAGFQATLANCGLQPADYCRFRTFPDHYHYSERALAELARQAREADASALLTTQKDLVKIERTDLAGYPLWAVEIGTQILRGRELLEERLARLLRTIPPTDG